MVSPVHQKTGDWQASKQLQTQAIFLRIFPISRPLATSNQVLLPCQVPLNEPKQCSNTETAIRLVGLPLHVPNKINELHESQNPTINTPGLCNRSPVWDRFSASRKPCWKLERRMAEWFNRPQGAYACYHWTAVGPHFGQLSNASSSHRKPIRR